MTKVPPKQIGKISISLKEWEVDGWAEDLRSAMKIEIDDQLEYGQFSINLTFDDVLEEKVKKIGEDILQTFFAGRVWAKLSEKGVLLWSEEMDVSDDSGILIPWLGFDGPMFDITSLPLARALSGIIEDQCEAWDIPFPIPDDAVQE